MAAPLLPRFLLPGLSWQNSIANRQTVRALSTIASYCSAEQPASHLARRPFPRSSIILQDSAHRRLFHATTRRQRDHHFDTLKFVQRLQEEGFTEAQSVAMMKVLSDVIEERYCFPGSLIRIMETMFYSPETNMLFSVFKT